MSNYNYCKQGKFCWAKVLYFPQFQSKLQKFSQQFFFHTGFFFFWFNIAVVLSIRIVCLR